MIGERANPTLLTLLALPSQGRQVTDMQQAGSLEFLRSRQNGRPASAHYSWMLVHSYAGGAGQHAARWSLHSVKTDKCKDLANRSKAAVEEKRPACPGDTNTDGPDPSRNWFVEWPWNQTLKLCIVASE
jgi:hypothetical protein